MTTRVLQIECTIDDLFMDQVCSKYLTLVPSVSTSGMRAMSRIRIDVSKAGQGPRSQCQSNTINSTGRTKTYGIIRALVELVKDTQ